MISVLNIGTCLIDADAFRAEYTASKVYLGRNNTLEQDVNVDLEFTFNTDQELQDFFTWWQTDTLSGGRPFYVEVPLYGSQDKFYLVQLNGTLEHTSSPYRVVSGTFTLYRNRTLDENIAPEYIDSNLDIDMDSTNNFVLFKAQDLDLLTYSVLATPTNGQLTNAGDGVFYYTPTDGFSGMDSFVVQATDELGVTAQATMQLNVINWKLFEEFKLVVGADGHLVIDYVNPTTLDPLIIQAVDEMSAGVINSAGEYTLDYTNTPHIQSLTKTATDEWVITPQ